MTEIIDNIDNNEFFNILNDRDEHNIPFDFYDVRDALNINGIKAIHLLFDYYEEHNTSISSWCNYMLACSAFTKEELEASENKNLLKKLERKIKNSLRKQSINLKEYNKSC